MLVQVENLTLNGSFNLRLHMCVCICVDAQEYVWPCVCVCVSSVYVCVRWCVSTYVEGRAFALRLKLSMQFLCGIRFCSASSSSCSSLDLYVCMYVEICTLKIFPIQYHHHQSSSNRIEDESLCFLT